MKKSLLLAICLLLLLGGCRTATGFGTTTSITSLAAVLERFTLTVRSLSRDTVKSIAGRDWILSMG